MIQMPPTKLPTLKHPELKALFDIQVPTVIALADHISEQMRKAEKSRSPSEIYQIFFKLKDDIKIFSQFLNELTDKNVASIEKKFIDSRDSSQSEVATLREKLSHEQGIYNNRWLFRVIAGTGTAGGTVALELFNEIGKFIDDSDSYQTPGQRMLDEIGYIERSLSRASDDLSKLNTFEGDFTVAQNFKLSRLYYPAIFSLIADHGIRVHEVLKSYSDYHCISPDEIVIYLEKTDPVSANSLLALLKADYKKSDLVALTEYGGNAAIAASPAQRTLLQFINEAMLNHFDSFEIWESKMNDLENNQSQISEIIGNNSVKGLPKLEMLGQKQVSLNGIIEEQPLTVADKPATVKALKFALSTDDEARKKVTTLINNLNNPGYGSIILRHQLVKGTAVQEIQKFSILFNGVDTALKQIDIALNQKTAERSKTLQLFLSAEAIANQIDVLKFNSPENLRAFKRKLLWWSAGARYFGGDNSVLAELLSGGIQNQLTNERYEKEYRIRMESLLKRQYGNPDELKKTVDCLDAEIEKLLDNKEFMGFLANGSLEHVRAVYMILTRLVAGEANVEALDQFARAARYNTIDELTTEVRATNPRLAQAMEKFAYGFADSGDLEILIAEGNCNKGKRSAVQQLLKDFSEEILKPHWPDLVRQASIVDYLQLRNALYTGHPFHSFGEIVKKSEPALIALLSGNGDFVLTGNRDVHEHFGHYLCRHGEHTFTDLYDRCNRKPKGIMLSPSDDLRNKNREIAAVRSEETIVPRLGNVFIEHCTYEYMLSLGNNIIKNRKLKSHPHVLGATEMINEIVRFIIEELSMKPLGKLVERVVADACIQFFSELGALHRTNLSIQEKIRMLKNSYTGENFSLPHSLYTKMIISDARAQFKLFLKIYQQVLQTYLKTSTVENRLLLLHQLKEVEPVMKSIQPAADMVWPDSEQALLNAYYRSHSLSNVSINRDTWYIRSMAVSMIS